ncbi:dCTP deaminase domain-containing protein [Butyrivibrio sp. AD3002]|uniref:dCTP deaminase domain-containing protein n=1 Tax=Butyrivibrio sp. AD3002 TaxID=1280670 RepID=UPI0003B404BC|nr:hypothetical protein [Butyrivibrio sp. AD3002]
MLLYDKKLMSCGSEIITPFDKDKITNIGYDISTEKYTLGNNKESTSVKLQPHDSAFVMSKESIELPQNILAKVVLRNSRIRQGLSIDAPIYQPGHKTKIFFRITNFSDKEMNLTDLDDFATIIFEELDGDVEKGYSGTFQSEFDYRGMGDYSSVYNRELDEIDNKIKDLKEVEKHIYGNVLTIMAIFVGVFSLINLNVSFAGQGFDTKYLLVLNLVTIGSVGILLALVDALINNSKNKIVWAVPVISFILSILIHVVF